MLESSQKFCKLKSEMFLKTNFDKKKKSVFLAPPG